MVRQPPYMFGTTQVEVYLKLNSVYYIVPSLYNRKQRGVYSEVQYSNVQCVEYSYVYCSAVQYSIMQFSTVHPAEHSQRDTLYELILLHNTSYLPSVTYLQATTTSQSSPRMTSSWEATLRY
jgi:hypothetical protein